MNKEANAKLDEKIQLKSIDKQGIVRLCLVDESGSGGSVVIAWSLQVEGTRFCL